MMPWRCFAHASSIVHRTYSRTSAWRSAGMARRSLRCHGKCCECRGLGDHRPPRLGVILVGADGKKPKQQSVDHAEILQIHGERGVEPTLLRQLLRTKGRSNKSPEPENRHEARAEKDDREQRRNVVDPGEQKSQPPPLNGSLGESSVGEQYPWRLLCGARTSRRGQRGRQRKSEILAFVIREEAREHEPVAMRSKRELGRPANARLE